MELDLRDCLLIRTHSYPVNKCLDSICFEPSPWCSLGECNKRSWVFESPSLNICIIKSFSSSNRMPSELVGIRQLRKNFQKLKFWRVCACMCIYICMSVWWFFVEIEDFYLLKIALGHLYFLYWHSTSFIHWLQNGEVWTKFTDQYLPICRERFTFSGSSFWGLLRGRKI